MNWHDAVLMPSLWWVICCQIAPASQESWDRVGCHELYAMAGMDSEGRLILADEPLPDSFRSETLETGFPPSPPDFTSTFAIVGGKVIEPKTPALTPLPPERKRELLTIATDASQRSSQKVLSKLLTNPRTQQITVHILEARETLLALRGTPFFEDFARNLRAFQYWYPEKEERDAAWKKWFQEQANHYQVSFSPKTLEALSQLRDTYPTVRAPQALNNELIASRIQNYISGFQPNDWIRVEQIREAQEASEEMGRSKTRQPRFKIDDLNRLMRSAKKQDQKRLRDKLESWYRLLVEHINKFLIAYEKLESSQRNINSTTPDIFEMARLLFFTDNNNKDKNKTLTDLLTPLLRAVICPEAPALFTKEDILQRLRANTAKELETQIAVLNSHQAEEHKEALATFVTVIGATSQDSKTPQEDAPRNIISAPAPAVNTQAQAQTHSRPAVTHRRKKKGQKQGLPNTPSAPSQEALPPFDPNSLSEQESKALLKASFFRETERETFMQTWSSLQAKVQPDLADRLKINILQLTHKLRHNAPVRDLKLNRVGKNLFEFYPLGSAQNPRLFIAKIHNRLYLYALELNPKQSTEYQHRLINQYIAAVEAINRQSSR